jgi:hypothetical protein
MIILMHKLRRFSRCLFFKQMLSKFVPLCTPLYPFANTKGVQSFTINNLATVECGLQADFVCCVFARNPLIPKDCTLQYPFISLF